VQVWHNSKMPFPGTPATGGWHRCTDGKIRINPASSAATSVRKGLVHGHACGTWLTKQPASHRRYDLVEELMAAIRRHPLRSSPLKLGSKKTAPITRQARHLIFDSGGYAVLNRRVGVNYGSHGAGPYQNGRRCASMPTWLYTNHVPCGSMRAPPDDPRHFASEAQSRPHRRELGMDPVESANEEPGGRRRSNSPGTPI